MDYEYSFKPKKRIMHCYNCFINHVYSGGKAFCKLDQNIEVTDNDITRPDNCPLVEKEVRG